MENMSAKYVSDIFVVVIENMSAKCVSDIFETSVTWYSEWGRVECGSPQWFGCRWSLGSW